MRSLLVGISTSAILAGTVLADCGGVDNLFPMDGIVNNKVYDLNGTSANVIGNLAIGNGRVNSAIEFDGSSYLTLSDSNYSNFDSDFSIVAFIKSDAKKMTQSIIDKRDGTKGYHLFLNSPATSEATLALEINGVNFGNPNTKTLNDNKWHCVAVSVDRDANDGGKLYIDPQNGIESDNYHEFNPTVASGDSSNNVNLTIGTTSPNQMFNSKFEGSIDEVAFSSKPLTVEEINCLCSRNEMSEAEKDLPLIPIVEENSILINHQFEQSAPALTAILDLNATSTENIAKNSLIPLTITTINVVDVNLSANDGSVYFKQDGDIVYASFTKSGEYNVTLQGFDNSKNYLSDTVTFTTLPNSAPTSSNSEFNINSNEVLKFDGNTYFSDLDGDFLTYTLEGDNPKGRLQISNNVIIFTPDKESYATSFSLKATDPDGASVTATFNINVTFSSEIELLRGWNLLGNSIADKGINSSAILENTEVIYTLDENGFWKMSTLDIPSTSKYIKPKEGFWLKVADDRKFTINPIDNALVDSQSKQIVKGWNLLAHTKEVALRELKYGYDQIFVYDKPNNSWINSTTNPNYILSTFQGYWGRAVDVNDTPSNHAPNINLLISSIPTPYEVQVNTDVDINFSNFVDSDGDSVTLSIENISPELILSKTTNISDGENIILTTPPNEGNYTFSIKLTDEHNLSSATRDFQINVVPEPNNPPIITQMLDNIGSIYSINSTRSLNFSNFIDPDGDNNLVKLEIEDLSGQLTFNKISNIGDGEDVNVTTPNSYGIYSFRTRLIDGGSAYSEWKNFDLNVSVNDIDPFNDSRQIAFYKFEGNANDTMGSYDGNGTDVNYTTGQVGQAVDFNGINSDINVSTFDINLNNDFALNMWLKFPTGTGYRNIFSTVNTGSERFFIHLNNNKLYLDNSSGYQVTSDTNLSLDKYFMLTVVSNDGNVTAYVDGSSVFNDGPRKINVSSTTGFNLGGSMHTYNGEMDQFRIFNRSLSPEEIQELYNLEK